MAEMERSLALFMDFENLALGFQGKRERFDVQRVLKRMVEKGKIVAKKAYADWNRFSSYTESLHEAAIELVEIPRRAQTGKNSADIRLCVDAMDLAYSKEHIDTFVVVSGDSDFSPLVSKLKELGKHVIGLGMQVSTSELLRDNCDEFIYYEDLETPTAELPNLDPQIPEAKRKAFALLIDSLHALRRENKEVLWSSMIKDTMKRIKPSFNETYHGYRTFSALLEDAKKHALIDLETDKRSGTYVVTGFGEELKGGRAADERPVRRDLSRGRSRRSAGPRAPVRTIRGPRPTAPIHSPTHPAQAETPAAAAAEERRPALPEPPGSMRPSSTGETPPAAEAAPAERAPAIEPPLPAPQEPKPQGKEADKRQFGRGVFD
jgi:uncharacterized protein (TIGR00288 family)